MRNQEEYPGSLISPESPSAVLSCHNNASHPDADGVIVTILHEVDKYIHPTATPSCVPYVAYVLMHLSFRVGELNQYYGL